MPPQRDCPRPVSAFLQTASRRKDALRSHRLLRLSLSMEPLAPQPLAPSPANLATTNEFA
eukprot:796244-Alexandrium_andersonii.AAC.1